MAEIENNISSFNPQLWRLGEWNSYETEKPINIDSLGGDFDAWFDVGDKLFPTDKQISAWMEFCRITQTSMKSMLIERLTKLSEQMELLPARAKPEFGPIIRPTVVARNARKTIDALSKSRKPIGKQSKSIFLCNSIVIPLQDKAPVRFVVMNFQIGRGRYEFETLFCNGKMLMVGENSGLWTRLDWNDEFNVPNFKAETALHPYWHLE